jgi:hypothetical protein
MAVKAQVRPPRGDHRNTRLILTQQEQFPSLSCFSKPAGPVELPLAGLGQL